VSRRFHSHAANLATGHHIPSYRLTSGASGGITVVGEAADGRQAVEEARRLRPDVVLMDVRMPGMDGIQAISQLAALGLDPPVRVLVPTTFDLDEYGYAALRVGASGFPLKDAPYDVLIRAIGVVAAADAMLAHRSPGG
jgi:DNA-binding NarL/FixJ family response regulator